MRGEGSGRSRQILVSSGFSEIFLGKPKVLFSKGPEVLESENRLGTPMR